MSPVDPDPSRGETTVIGRRRGGHGDLSDTMND